MKRGSGRHDRQPHGRRRETRAPRTERAATGRARAAEEPRPARGITGELFVTAAGDGLVLRDDGEAMAKVPGAALGGAIHGDRVRVEIVREAPVWTRYARGRTGRPLAEVRELLARAPRRLTGRVRHTPHGVEFEPDDAKFPTRLAVDGPAAWPDEAPVVASLRPVDPAAAGRVAVEIVAAFPARGGIGMEIDRILVREGLSPEFAPDAAAQAAALTPESLLGGTRRDLTHLPFVTIDPEDARDHDDAVAVVPAAGAAAEAGAVDAWVAIADVGAAVPAGTPLDREARTRGVSVYLPDRVLRMLPDAPSADACSLRAARERAALAVRVRLDGNGRPVGPAEVSRAVVRSRAYLTYGQVGRLLGGAPADAAESGLAPDTLEALALADRTARLLRARRLAAGALDLEQPEALVLPDGAGGVASIRARATTEAERDAYRLIEELMLLANRAVARWLLGRGAPAVYRVHEPPDEAEVRRFALVARHYGIPLRVDRGIRPGALADALRAMRGRPFAQPLASLLLRALKQARYAPDNLGHFGLAFREYLHFTSPIRRYPDLVVHRLVGAVLDGATPGELEALGEREDVAGAAATASARERRAMLVEREVVDLCGAWLLRGRIGDEFAGRVAGLAAPGVFVRLEEPFVEGLVALEDLPADEWRLFPDELRLVGATTGRSFRLGDELRIRVLDASLARRRAFFALVEGGRPGRRPR
jgi:ribonuclease R